MFGRMLPSSGQYVEQQGTGGYVFKPRGMKLIIYLKAQCYFFPVLCVYVVSLISSALRQKDTMASYTHILQAHGLN